MTVWREMRRAIGQWDGLRDVSAQACAWLHVRMAYEKKMRGWSLAADLLRDGAFFVLAQELLNDPVAFGVCDCPPVYHGLCDAVEECAIGAAGIVPWRTGWETLVSVLAAGEGESSRCRERQRLALAGNGITSLWQGRGPTVTAGKWAAYLIDEIVGPDDWHGICESNPDIAQLSSEAAAGAHVAGILADALEDDGCTHMAAMQHLRQIAHHGPGCWVLDSPRWRVGARLASQC